METPSTSPAWEQVAPILAEMGFENLAIHRTITEDDGAYSPAGRWIVELQDGTRRFVKAMRARPLDTLDPGLEREHAVYVGDLVGLVPRLYGWHAGKEGQLPSVLVVEDLSLAEWGIPLPGERVGALRVALDRVAKATPPSALPAVEAADPWPGCGWEPLLVASDRLVATGIVDARWLDAHGELLATSSAAVDCSGVGLVHGDLWMQNWCGIGDRAVIVDWTGARRGNPLLNHAWGECGVRAAGGTPGVVLSDAHPEHRAWAAWMGGLALSFLVFDDSRARGRERLHATQAREATSAVRWMCDAHDLPVPVADPAACPAGPWQP